MVIDRSVSAVTSAVRGLGLICCVVFGLNAAGAEAAGAERALAVLQYVSGNPAIFELSNGEPRHASFVVAGRSYALPIEIETGAADAATFALSNSVIEVAPNSLMRIVAPGDHGASVVQRVWQQAGSALFRVHRGTIERFQVETPFLVSVVKGTVFNVLVHDDGATVSLQEGRLQVASIDSRQTVELVPGGVAFAGRDGVLRVLEVELTDSGAKASPKLAHTVDHVADARSVDRADGISSVVPPVGLPGAAVELPDLNGAAKSVAARVVAGSERAGASVVPPVVGTAAPVVDNVVASVVDPVVAPVIVDVVAPAVDDVVAPIVTPLVEPLVDDVVDPLIGDGVDPLIGDVVDPLAEVVDPLMELGDSMTNPLLDPLTDPLLSGLDDPSDSDGGGGAAPSGLLGRLF